MLRAVAAAGRLLRAAVALAVLAGFTAGVPWLLASFIGWPLDWIGWPHPDTLPGADDLLTAISTAWSDDKLLALLATLGWLLWALFCRDVVVEVIEASAAAAATREGDPRAPTPSRGPLAWAAAALVGAIVGAIVLDTVRGAVNLGTANAANAATTAARTPAVAVAPAHPKALPAGHVITRHGPRPAVSVSADPIARTAVTKAINGDTEVPGWARNAPGGIHHVVEGDNLWDIAEAKLSDPNRWREIYVLNRGHLQANGYALTDPDIIHIGWVLVLPERQSAAPAAPTTGQGNRPPAKRPAQTGPPVTASPATPTPSTPSTTAPASPAPTTTSSADTAPAEPVPAGPSRPASTGTTTASPSPSATDGARGETDPGHGVTLPSQGWVSLGLAATIAAAAALLRMQRRRRARLAFPIPLRTGPVPAPIPDSLRRADAAGSRLLAARTGGTLPDLMPETPSVPAPIGVDEHGQEIGLFEVPGRAVTLDGDGASAAARAIVTAVLATGVTDHLPARPVLVTPADTLAQLLPDDVAPHGLDPGHETFDGERLIVVPDVAAAVTHLETEMIHRRRLLDDMGVDTVDELNARTDHAEYLAPYVLLVPAEPRYMARVLAVAVHRQALHLHPVILGALPDAPNVAQLHVVPDGTFATTMEKEFADSALPRAGRLAVLSARDLADALDAVAAVAARPEIGHERTDPLPESEPEASPYGMDLPEIPERVGEAVTPAPVRLQVLGPPTLATVDRPISTGVRRGSLAVLAVLAAHPRGRTFDELAADLHPDADPETGINRVRTDLNAVRSLLREATGIEGRGKFIVYDGATGRYRIDPDLIEVDLWRMLSALDRANNAGDDETACLAALREAVARYRGDFAEGHDQAWVIDYATTYRHQLLAAYARIAEILETDQPDQAIAALETAIDHDPVNEELYQRIMRIHGRLGRPDAVRRTLRLLENRLAELAEAEPSEATRRVAARQLKPTLSGQR
jgi:DNA-binding SARP family transcriptional activator